MNTIKKAKKLLIVDTFVIVTILLFLLISKKSLVLYNDQIFQYDVFYETWANMLHRFFTTGELPFYSFNTYLGSDFYSSMLYYCTGNIFFPLMILFRNNIRVYVIIEFILCIYISSFTMYLFLKEEKIENENISLYASLMYSFSGFVLINTGNYMFMRFYAFFPLALLGISYLINNKKTLVFILSIAILFAQNYYLMWPASILMFLFFLYKMIEKKETKKNTIKLFIKFIVLYVLGMLFIAFLLLPGIYYIINNSRIGVSNSVNFVFDIGTIMSYIQDFIVPNVSLMSPTALQSINPDDYHIYSSSAAIGLMPLITSICYIKNNISKTSVFLILIMGYIFTGISSILHGFSNPSFRWIFILIPIILLFSSKQLQNDKQSKLDNIFVLYLVLVIISFVVSCCVNYSKEIYIDLIVHIVFICINVLLYFIYKKDINLSLKLTNVLYIIAFVFIIAFSCFTIPEKTKTFDSYTIDRLNDTSDDLMFRIYTPYQIFHYDSVLQLNESMREKYMSTSTYSSVNDPAINRFHSILGLEGRIVELSDENILSMLGVKHFILPKDNKYNTNNKTLTGYMNGEYPIYTIDNYKGFSKTFEKIKNIDEYKRTEDFNTTLFVDNDYDYSSYKDLHYSKLNIIEKSENHLIGEIELDSNNILLVPIPNNKGWKILDNGNIIKPINVNGGFIGLPLESGEHTIEMYFKPFLLKEGLIISGVSILSYALFLIKKRINIQFHK